MSEARLIRGDCVGEMAKLPECSIDAVVCDPPYLIGFMGKEFDSQHKTFVERKSNRRAESFEASVGNHNPTDAADAARTRRSENQKAQAWHEAWSREALRVLKPGGYLLAFGGSRTYHRLACAVEDASFEIRDRIEVNGLPVVECPDGSLAWMYGSGFPKSKNIGDGRGTALKPAHEPVVVARKPLSGTVAATVLEHGTGALNIDACRVGFRDADDERGVDARSRAELGNYDAAGRWPANVAFVHHEDCVRLGDVQVAADGHWSARRSGDVERTVYGQGGVAFQGQEGLSERSFRCGERVEAWDCHPDCAVRALDAQTGGASRFFYTAKASRAERNAGLGDDFAEGPLRWSSGEQSPGTFQSDGTNRAARNAHPTVKPIALMRWLARLVTPPGGTVLDPFAGSGTTGIACALEGFDFVGIERDDDYALIAEARIAFWREHGEDGLRIVREREEAETRRAVVEAAGQLSLIG